MTLDQDGLRVFDGEIVTERFEQVFLVGDQFPGIYFALLKSPNEGPVQRSAWTRYERA